MLLAPSSSRVFSASLATLAAAELEVTTDFAREIHPDALSGAPAVGFEAEQVDPAGLARQSTALVHFERCGELLRPLDIAPHQVLADDILTIPKYQGKTNEAFTRLLVHLTCSQVERAGQFDICDPMAGRGTTLWAAWMIGHHAYGIEAEARSVDAGAAFIKTYLRTKRIKHSAQVGNLRSHGRKIGRSLDVTARLGEATSDRPASDLPTLKMRLAQGDAREIAGVFGKQKFDALITDAPYGVVHGSAKTVGSSSGPAGWERSPRALLTEAIPAWAAALRPGGAIGIGWNALSMGRDELARVLAGSGLEVRDQGAWRSFGHRVDSSIRRDVLVAVKPGRRAKGDG